MNGSTAQTGVEEATTMPRAYAEDVLDSMSDAVFVYDRDWRFVALNRAARANSIRAGLVPDDMLGRSVWDVFPSLVGTAVHAAMLRAARERTTESFESQGGVTARWYETTVFPIQDGIAAHTRDVTCRKRDEVVRRILADASVALAGSLDPDETLRTLAKVVVPALADGCVIDLLSDDGTPERVATVFADPGVESAHHELRTRFRHEQSPAHPVHGVLRTGEPFMATEITARGISDLFDNAEEAALITRLGLTSTIIVPLAARDRVLGTMSLGTHGHRPRFEERDLEAAMELSRRAALAIDNARLHRASEVSRREAEAARRESEAASRAKTDFLAMMSHELRTPLNAIAGYVELLELGIRGPVTDAQREDLQRIRRSQQILLSLVNDVLNFARLESGQVRYDVVELDLDDVLHDVGSLVEPLMRSKNLEYEYRCRSVPTTAMGDRDKVDQILLNLLSNAAKYTDHGSVRVECDASDDVALVRVIDTGRGIAAEQLDAIFEPFVRVDKGLTKLTDGSGLGLAISRNLARAMGGELTVQSRVGEGAEFTLRLPRSDARVDTT